MVKFRVMCPGVYVQIGTFIEHSCSDWIYKVCLEYKQERKLCCLETIRQFQLLTLFAIRCPKLILIIKCKIYY